MWCSTRLHSWATAFIIFINDLPKYVQSCNLYADDTMIEKSGKTLDEIIPYIQSDIDNLLDWFYSNKLTVSNDKSCYMLIGSFSVTLIIAYPFRAIPQRKTYTKYNDFRIRQPVSFLMIWTTTILALLL